jgi:hypothetical protein
LFVKQEKRIILTSLNSIDKFNELETREQNKHKKETRRETQLLILSGKTLTPANSFSVYSLTDFPNPFDNPSFVASLVNYNPLDPF